VVEEQEQNEVHQMVYLEQPIRAVEVGVEIHSQAELLGLAVLVL
jgi:hypothetical protein